MRLSEGQNDDYQVFQNIHKTEDWKQKEHNQLNNKSECTIKINGVNQQINLQDLPSQLFNQSVRNSVYMSNSFNSSPLKKYNYQQREWKIQDFKVIKQLGCGKYGQVFLCKDIMTNFMVAVKVISQKVIDQEDLERQLAREIMIHSYLKHPNIL